MNILRRMTLGAMVAVMSFLLMAVALSWGAFIVLDKPDSIKKALQDSGIYQVFIRDIAGQKLQASQASLPLDSATISTAFSQAYTPAFVRQTAEHSVDTTYDWLHGKIERPDYHLDVSGPQKQLTDTINGLVQAKAASLPVCPASTSMESMALQAQTLTCRPAGISTEQIAKEAKQYITSSSALNEATTSASQNLGPEQSEALAQKLAVVPDAYRYFVISLYIVPVVIVALAVGIVFYSSTRSAGLKRVGKTLITSGVTITVLTLLAVWAIRYGVNVLNNQESALLAVQSKLLQAAQLLASRFRNWWIGFGVLYIAAGIGLLFLARQRGTKAVRKATELNSKLGYNADIPGAGTTFRPPEKDETK